MARKIEVQIVGDSRSLERAFSRSEKSAKSFNQSVTKSRGGGGGLIAMAKLATGYLGVTGLAGAAHAAFQEMQSAQQVSAQTAAGIESTGAAAHVSAKRVDALANAMLKKTGIDDEATKTAENMLLTFTRVRNEVGKGNNIFDQATQAVADMATKMSGGAVPSAEQMQAASIRLGKALNDPVKGVGALSRVGVQFTKQQKDQIKALVESGHTMDAQKMILRELSTEMGGAANAAGKTFAGQTAILRNTLLNLGASIAQILTPQIQRVVEQMTKWLSNSKNQESVLNTVKAVASALGDVLSVLTGIFRALNGITGSTRNSVLLLVSAFGALKALKLVGYFRSLAVAAGMAGGAGGIGGAGRLAGAGRMLGPAALAAGGGYALSKGIRKIPGWESTFRGVGGSIYDMFHHQSATAAVGPRQTTITIHNLHTGATSGRQLENDLVRRNAQRAGMRRGAR